MPEITSSSAKTRTPSLCTRVVFELLDIAHATFDAVQVEQHGFHSKRLDIRTDSLEHRCCSGPIIHLIAVRDREVSPTHSTVHLTERRNRDIKIALSAYFCSPWPDSLPALITSSLLCCQCRAWGWIIFVDTDMCLSRSSMCWRCWFSFALMARSLETR